MKKDCLTASTRLPKKDIDLLDKISEAEKRSRSNIIAEIVDHCLNKDNLSCITKLFPRYIQTL